MKPIVGLVAVGFAACFTIAACGGDDSTSLTFGEGGADGALVDEAGNLLDEAGHIIDSGGGFPDGGTGNDGGWNGGTLTDGGVNCLNLGLGCKAPSDCCSGNCLNGACQPPKCVSDNLSCGKDADCCSGTCTAGKCAPLNNSCRTLGNSCSSGGDCCSQFCESGICAQPSYCTQQGDICTKGGDCCGHICTVANGQTFGVCGQPKNIGAQCSMIDGVVCAGIGADGGIVPTDGGIPTCGGGCCSRSCAPWGPTDVLVCQPASGCKPVGDICAVDADCCGGFGMNPTQKCSKANLSDPVGICSNPSGCKPDGDICRLKTNQCNATDNCCSGNVQQFNTCHQDLLGVPRCSYKKGDPCVPSNGGCSSSADCCNLNPCVPNMNGNPPFVCYPTACVPKQGPCTTSADCCPGNTCYIPNNATTGSCQPLVPPPNPDGGMTPPPCSLYGQTCSTTGDCCNGVPCNSGRCEYPPPN